MLFSFFDAVDWGTARLGDYVDFLRSIPSLFAPKPSPTSLPYTPPFIGGQCVGVSYQAILYITPPSGTPLYWCGVYSSNPPSMSGLLNSYSNNSITGAVPANAQLVKTAPTRYGFQAIYQVININGSVYVGMDDSWIVSLYGFRKNSDGTDNCGNPPNPIPSPLINDDGLFSPNNPVIGDENGTLNSAAIILSPAAPIIAIGGGLALAAAAAAAAKAATDALEAIKKVAEALDSLKKLWEKLQEFLEEWDKDRPKNRDIVRQTYGNIDGDGAIDFYPLNNKNFVAIQVDIVVTEVPVGFGKYFGNMSPSRYRYKELGYISFYSISKGIIETHSIQFKRTSLIIPKTAIGFIYHFGLDNKIKGFAFGTFSVRKN